MSDTNPPTPPTLAALQKQVVEQAAELARIKSGKKQKTGDEPSPAAKALKAIIDSSIKAEGWRLVKFIGGDADLQKVSRNLLMISGIGENAEGGPTYKWTDQTPADVAKIAQWVEDYKHVVSSCWNEHRNYVQGRIKKVCTDYLKAGKDLPSVDAVERVLYRRSDHDENVFAWWWDVILPMAVGNKVHWNHKVRYFEKISESNIGTSAQKNIPPSTEAFAFVVYESNRAKWVRMKELKEENPGLKMVVLDDKNSKKKKSDFNVSDPECFYAFTSEEPDLIARWTNPRSGQSKFGGWKREGKERFKKVRASCSKGRKLATCPGFEEIVFDLVRANKGYTGKDWAEHSANVGKAKPKDSVAALPDIEDLGEESDEEFIAL